MTLDELIEQLNDIKNNNPASYMARIVLIDDVLVKDVKYDGYYNEVIIKR